MTDLLIRDLDARVMAGLTERAMRNRTTPEDEARRLLSEGAAHDAEAWRARATALRQEIGPLRGPSSTDLLRADRYGSDPA